MPTVTQQSDLYPFFFELVDGACNQGAASHEPVIREYLAKLLVRFVRREQSSILFEPIIFEFYRYIQEGNLDQGRIREIADGALFVAGVLVPGKEKLIGQKQYIDVGECAYRLVLQRVGQNNSYYAVYEKFSQNLWPYVSVLARIRNEHIFVATMEEIITVFERYDIYGKEEDLRWLLEHGIVVLPRTTVNPNIFM